MEIPPVKDLSKPTAAPHFCKVIFESFGPFCEWWLKTILGSCILCVKICGETREEPKEKALAHSAFEVDEPDYTDSGEGDSR